MSGIQRDLIILWRMPCPVQVRNRRHYQSHSAGQTSRRHSKICHFLLEMVSLFATCQLGKPRSFVFLDQSPDFYTCTLHVSSRNTSFYQTHLRPLCLIWYEQRHLCSGKHMHFMSTKQNPPTWAILCFPNTYWYPTFFSRPPKHRGFLATDRWLISSPNMCQLLHLLTIGCPHYWYV